MRTLSRSISIRTGAPLEILDITPAVKKELDSMRLRTGFVVITTRHTTTGLCINENCERLKEDMKDFLLRLAPQGKDYRHDHETIDGRNNAHSHLLSMFLRTSEIVPVDEGQMALGTWQTIFFIEMDGPRGERHVTLTAIGEFQQ